jgi:type VI secretion system secreted protein Hcp
MNRARISFAVGALTALAAMMPGTAVAQGPATRTAYLKIDPSIQGSATDRAHLNWVEVTSFDVENTLNIGSQGGGAGAGKMKFNAFTITRKIDRASPSLYQALTSGKHFPSVVVEIVLRPDTGAGKLVVERITLTDALLSRDSNTGGGAATPTETLQFVFKAITVETARQNADGTTGIFSKVADDWDIKANSKI